MNKLYVLLLLVLLAAGLWGCAHSGGTDAVPQHPDTTLAPLEPDALSEEGQLIALAETREDAEALASLYGITLVNCQNSIALFRTDEDPREVIRRGTENGWPELSLNRVQELS